MTPEARVTFTLAFDPYLAALSSAPGLISPARFLLGRGLPLQAAPTFPGPEGAAGRERKLVKGRPRFPGRCIRRGDAGSRGTAARGPLLI